MTNRIVLAMVDIAHRDNSIVLCSEAQRQLSSGDELHVAYVIPYGNYSYIEPYISKESIKAAAKKAHNDLNEIIADAKLPAVKTHILRGSIGEQTLLLAKKIDASLLMINAHRRDVEVHTLGSNAAQIVRHASSSVMVVR